jgi:histidine triad (HIT) family protein
VHCSVTLGYTENMEPSIFTRIIRGEIPCHKIYEDDKTFAFLDIHPARPGHTLVIPKVQVDRVEDLTDEDYDALMQSVRKVMRRIVEVYGHDYRACVKIIGFDVPHAHVQVFPCRTGKDWFAPQDHDAEPNHAALAEVAAKLAF